MSSQDWVGLINLGVTTVTQLLEARAQHKAELAAISPELADMTAEAFHAVFAPYYTAEERLAAAAAGLVEAGASEKAAGGTLEDDGA